MKGYMGFAAGMICDGKQYAENTVYEIKKEEIGEIEMHFFKSPLDVLDYYPLIGNNGSENEYAEVEVIDETKLKVGAKISFEKLVEASVNIVSENAPETNENLNALFGPFKETRARIVSSEDRTQISSSEVCARIGSSGDRAQISSSGDRARIGSSGDRAKISSAEGWAEIGSTGNDASIGSSGDWTQIASAGAKAQIGSYGYSARIGSSGDGAQIVSAGGWADIASAGENAKIVSEGHGERIASAGYNAQIASRGENAVIMCAGSDSIAKAKKGSWITLAEWGKVNEEYIPVCVKTERVDGERIKEDTWYRLVNGIFAEVER